MIIEILAGDGYPLTLNNAHHLAVTFLKSHWQGGITATRAARLLNENGYVPPQRVNDKLTGRVLGHQSTLRNWGTLTWRS
jgi:hypothetical protein